LVTPESILLEEEVQAVILRTDVGDATFMPGHTRLIGALVPGSVRFQREDGSEERAAVHGGFVQVDGEHVVVLSPVAERAADIDIDRARRAAANAAERLAELRGAQSAAAADDATPDGDILGAEAAQRRAEVRLEVAGAGSLESHAAT
jgi:F-type H+-transporting ATPase subunit epsilon